MAYLDDIMNFGEESGVTARSQTAEADTYSIAIDFEESFKNYKGDLQRYYERQPVKAIGNIFLNHNFGEDLIYDRVWINQNIDFELIVEIKYDSVRIWNADLYDTALISDFDDPGHEGIAIETITPPVVLEPNEEAVYDLTVYPIGPAEQYTVYTYTVNGEDLTCTVIGKRIIPFPFPANWKNGVNISYGYNTSIYSSPTTHEQRRAIVDKVKRDCSFNVLLSKVQAQKFENLLRVGAGRYFGVPIYNEIFTTDSVITGQNSIIANEDISDFYNLNNNCDQLIIVDHSTSTAEIKIISEVSGQTITFSQDVVKSFTPNITTIYPIFIGTLDGYNFKNVTDTVISTSVSFKEAFIG